MRAAVYLRQSQDRSGEGLGIDRQREDCEKLIAQRGWSHVATHVDNDRSAAGRKPRPEFDALLAAVADGSLDAIVAWNLDRLTRNRRDQLRIVEVCEPRKTIIALCRGSDIDMSTPAGRMVAGVLATIARHEIEQKSDRQRRAMEQAADQGRWIGGRKPFGYETDGVTLIEREAQAVRTAYSDLLAGVSLRTIANDWNSRGLTTGQRPWRHSHLGSRSPWRADSVRRVLLNPRNAGIRSLRGEERGRAEWPPIVPEETYRAVVALLRDPQRWHGGTSAAGKQFLTGLALCGVCGLKVHGGGASHGKPIYRCRSGRHVIRLAEPVDDYVNMLVVGILSRPDAKDRLIVDNKRPDVPTLRDEANAAHARLDELAARFADGDITGAQLSSGTARVRARLTEIESQIADAGRLDILGPVITADNVAATWEAIGRDRRRAIVNILMSIHLHPVGRGTRTFRPETVEITPKAQQ